MSGDHVSAPDHDYDLEAARREAAVYRTDAAARRRELVRDHLALDGSESVVSVGCGPGFEPVELAEALDSGGRVLGIDASPAMLALARELRAERDPEDDAAALGFARGDATALPLPDDAADAATAVQVLEYLPEPEAALAELARVLRPGGRAVVLDTDWRTFVWRADDDERSQAVLDAWEERVPHPRIGSALASLRREAGFTVESVEPVTIAERDLEDGFFGHNLPFFVDYAAEHDAVGPETAAAWEADVRARDERGETFATLTQFCYAVRAP